MAKVKQTKMKLCLDPRYPWAETVVAVHYDGTDQRSATFSRPIPEKRFYIKLPPLVAGALEIEEVRGDDQVEVFKLFDEAVKAFLNMGKEINRVILYRIDVDPEPGGEPRWNTPEGVKTEIWAATYVETVAIAGDGARRYSYEHIESPVDFPGTGKNWNRPNGVRLGDRYNNQIPWTKQNEAFFVWVKDRMTDLIARLSEIKKPDNMIEAVNAGLLLPLGRDKE